MRHLHFDQLNPILNDPVQLERLSMVGVSGGKFPAIRKHLQENIGNVYKDMDVSYVVILSQKHASCVAKCPQIRRIPRE